MQEKDWGFVICSEEPFSIKWTDHEKKEAFYKKYFSIPQQAVYDVLKDFSDESDSEDCDFDYVVENSYYISYQQETHERLMNFIKTYATKEEFNRIRLIEVTGSFLNQSGNYDFDFFYVIRDILREKKKDMKLITQKLVEEKLQVAYEKSS